MCYRSDQQQQAHPMFRRLGLLAIFIAILSISCETHQEQSVLGDQLTGTAIQPDKPPGGEAVRLRLKQVFSNVVHPRPISFQTGDFSLNRHYLATQEGQIWQLTRDTNDEDVLFLDITERVHRGGNEEGLLGLAFHPDYADNRFIFVHYSANNPRRSVVSRFADQNPGTEMVILEVPQPYRNHNGGQLAFGPDGYLYIGLGDGGSSGDPQRNGQDGSTLLGSILRIDVAESSAERPYRIPPDNPFVDDSPKFRGEIWAYGFRNPWRFSFDQETGALWAGDVGQNRYEEVDVIIRGGNYGWNIMEGEDCYRMNTSCEAENLIRPIHSYPHENGSCSITGGYVYRGQRIPSLYGMYIYGDFCSGKIWGLSQSDGNTVLNQELLDSSTQIASFAEDNDGEIYILAFDGSNFRLEQTPLIRN